jgi:hypothetical protein
VADNTLSIRVPVSGAIPEDYVIGGASDIDVLAIMGDWDGSGSGSDFLPVVQFLDAAGQVIAQAIGAVIAAGGSATVTFAPFLESKSVATGGGIQFDTSPQAGDWLYVETDNESGSPNGYGMEFNDQSGGGIKVESLYGVEVLSAGSDGISLRDIGTGGAQLFSAVGVFIESGDVFVKADSSGSKTIYLDLSAVGSQVKVRNHSLAPIFEIREDGSVHGLASVGAITWDL